MRDISAQYTSQFQDSVIDFLPDDPEHVMVEVDYDVPQKPSVYKVNIYTSKKSRIEKGKLDIRSWITDQQHQVRIGRARDFNTGEVTYYHRFSEDEDFTELLSYVAFDDKPISILGFDLDPNLIYLTKYKGDKRALYKMDLRSKETTLLLAHEDYDVGNRLIYSGTTKEALGLYDYHSPYGRFYFDDNSYEFHRALDAALPDTKNYIRSFSDNEQVYLLYVESDSVSGQYLLGDRTKGSLVYLFSSYPDLDFVTLPKHKKITYTSRDGMEIEALLTLPKFGKAPYPTVVHPHGGPGARDSSGFDPWVSYMSSKGYAVVRPNFRGSSGYGFEFAQAQMKGWGLEMQDDIADATTQLIEKGIIDKSKVCIFGASYGGYAALMATTKTPDLFTCAVSFAGVSDLRDLSRNQQRFSGGDLVAEKQLGDDRRDLLERSPITHVENIKTPLLIMHGTEDRSVPVNQSRKFVEALKDENKVHKYVEFDYGDHYLSIASNRASFFDELDAFFNEHLGKVE
jgi:dipeptidyl aminopeptidase/acylaminoacyl peptidase